VTGKLKEKKRNQLSTHFTVQLHTCMVSFWQRVFMTQHITFNLSLSPQEKEKKLFVKEIE